MRPIRGLADPVRERRDAALAIAVAALREVERTSRDIAAAISADEALAKIRTLVPEIDP